MTLLVQAAVQTYHPLGSTVAWWLWAIPLLPLLGFVLNGGLSLFAAYKAGPSDPSALPHGDHVPADASSDAHAAATHDRGDHGHGDEAHGDEAHGDEAHGDEAHGDEAHAAVGDDHHPIARHRFAALTSVIGPGVMLLSFALSVAVFLALRASETATPYVQRYFSWISVGDLHINAAFQLDQLSMVMVLVITGVGFLIHVFSVGYMRDDPGYPRYFAYLNLFVFFMLVLVLGANYPLLFIGWEGVGLCSYLLIGFWFSEKANADAGKKAFIVNRIGDFGFLVAMFMLYVQAKSLDFNVINEGVASGALTGLAATAICLFLFLGCAGKSAQLPLYVWLPDAMAGPTPVSALIHAATMVTAGVYLIARSAALFSVAPVAGLTVAAIGGLTALFAASIGLKQWDIKKVLAYSTVSQLGFMFMAVGVGAYVAGIFHLVTHAFFKALLFLGSGSVIYAMHRAYHHTGSHEDAQDMRNMGGLRHTMPVTFWLMWIATLAIAGVPLFSGFFSKDEILAAIYARTHGSSLAETSLLGIPGSVVLYLVYAMALAAALMTAVYMTRMMLYTFHGPNRTGETERRHLGEAPWIMTAPLIVLAVLSVAGGWLNLPSLLGGLGVAGGLEHWLAPVVGSAALRVTHGEAPHLSHATEYVLIGIAVLIAAAGIAIAWMRLRPAALVAKREARPAEGFARVLEEKYYVDEVYDRTVVRPTLGISRAVLWRTVDAGLIDGLAVNGSGYLARFVGWVGSQLQSGQVGTYAWVLVLGVIAVLGAFTVR